MSKQPKAPETTGILMVMMECPDADEREFHDWYDIEHVPERDRIEGFRKVQRYVCLEGWPRYMALYDLDHIGILTEAPYAQVSGENFSPWSKRVIGAARGWTRTEAKQVYPGNAITGAQTAPLRLGVLRFRDVPESKDRDIAEALQTFLAETPGLLQFRLFRSGVDLGAELYAILEFSIPLTMAELDWRRHTLPVGHIDIANMYTRYWRKD